MNKICPVCEKDIDGSHVCRDCKQAVHLFICGDPVPNSEEGYGQPVICFKCSKKLQEGEEASTPSSGKFKCLLNFSLNIFTTWHVVFLLF